jgi:hypothetical protein
MMQRLHGNQAIPGLHCQARTCTGLLCRPVSSSSTSSSSSSSSSRRQPLPLQAARSRSRTLQCHARKQAAAAAPKQQQQQDGGDLLLLQVQAPDAAAGLPGIYAQYDPEKMELLPRYVETEELLDGLDGVDVQQAPEAAAALGDDVQVRM